MVEWVCVAATHGDCGLYVRIKRERRGMGRGWGRAAMVVRKGTDGFFDKFL